jgi:hypothetical protein
MTQHFETRLDRQTRLATGHVLQVDGETRGLHVRLYTHRRHEEDEMDAGTTIVRSAAWPAGHMLALRVILPSTHRALSWYALSRLRTLMISYHHLGAFFEHLHILPDGLTPHLQSETLVTARHHGRGGERREGRLEYGWTRVDERASADKDGRWSWADTNGLMASLRVHSGARAHKSATPTRYDRHTFHSLFRPRARLRPTLGVRVRRRRVGRVVEASLSGESSSEGQLHRIQMQHSNYKPWTQ